MARTLTLGGGGMRAGALLGYLEHIDLSQFGHFSGISMGSIFCLMFALGFDVADVSKMFVELDFSRWTPPAEEALSIGTTFGLSSGRPLRVLVETLLGSRGLPPDTQMRDVPNLSVVVSDVVANRAVLLRDSDVPVATAVAASCAIPIFFAPVKWGDALWVDGCHLADSPAELMEDPGPGDLHLILTDPRPPAVGSFLEYVWAVVNSPRRQRAATRRGDIVAIPVTGVSATDFAMPADRRREVIALGDKFFLGVD